MPRVYKRKLGSRTYVDYDEETLESALYAIRGGELTQREAATHYNIPRSTLKYKLKGEHSSAIGGQRILSEEVEHSISNHCIALSDFGFPIDAFDLRCIVQSYLNKCGIIEPRFKDNFPGIEWVRGFLMRRKELSVRFSSNIKKKRAAISKETIDEYFKNLSDVLQGVPPSNVWNYDETNLADDPGNKRVICKRGSKYPERIMNSTKAAISLMYCGNAEGTLMPPYVVYKSEHLWTTWTVGGPAGTHYNRSKSGWFDGFTFADWFMSIVIPTLRRQEGKKVLIGDNLSSHMNPDVIK